MGKSKKHTPRARELRIRELKNKSKIFNFQSSHISLSELAKVELFVGGVPQTINTTVCVKGSDNGSDTPRKPDRPFPRKPLRRRKSINVLKKKNKNKTW